MSFWYLIALMKLKKERFSQKFDDMEFLSAERYYT